MLNPQVAETAQINLILLNFFTAFNFGSNMRKRRKMPLEFWKNSRTFVQFFQKFLLFYVCAYTLISEKHLFVVYAFTLSGLMWICYIF